MIARLMLFPLLLVCASAAFAQEAELPALTGRVVDNAELLDTRAEARLTSMLAAHEQATSEQVVVVTVPDLQGGSIEEFGVQLGREWGIGQQVEDNGALLIVARDERRIRIEVGYGLEGRLTDAQSAMIINGIIVPAFQQGDFPRGIIEGAEAMVQVLGGDPLKSTALRPAMPMGTEQPGGLGLLAFFLMLVAIFVIGGGRGGRGGGRRALLLGALLGGMSRGGGFGGGGGGFGGGGASGGW